MSEIERLAAALRDARAAARVAQEAMYEAELALLGARNAELSAKVDLDRAIAELVNG